MSELFDVAAGGPFPVLDGAMPEEIFHGIYDKTVFVQYPDWTSSKKRRTN